MVHGELRVHLFGGLSVQWSNDPSSAPVTRFPTQKAAALLALLALSPGRRFTREVLADLLWTDAAVEDGRRSLRVALSALRRILEPPGTAPGTVLVTDRETVALRAEAVSTDVADFDAAVRRGDGERARLLYDAGPLLPAFYDDWVLDARARFDAAYALLPNSGAVSTALAEVSCEAPPAPRRDPREKLPHYLTRFVGRYAEIETLVSLWSDATNRLITVTGTGGIGKTRLVTRAATELSGERALRFVSLQDASDRDGLRRAMIAVLGLDPKQADDDSMVHALGVLGLARLILDNVEQLISSGIGETLEKWLASCPQLQITATSRQRLNVLGERELALSALVVPTLPATPERLLDFDSVRLLLDRAQLSRSDAQITPRNADTVAALCERLGGLPLALELTASWAGVLTFGQMLSRVEAHLLDEAGPPTAAKRAARPDRHRTLRAALNTSLELLTPTLRQAFIELAVFRGSFTAEAASAVLGPEAGAPETLSRLRERSLLVTEADAERETLRFRMLPTIYAFAQELLAADTARTTMLSEAHRNYFTKRAETKRTDETDLDADHEDFVAALAFASGQQAGDDLRLCVALASFWEARGHIRYGSEQFERALGRHPQADPKRLVVAQHWAGKLAYHLSDFRASQTHHQAALELAQHQKDRLGAGRARQGLASTALYRDSDIARATELSRAALADYRASGDLAAEAGMLIGLGVIATMQGRFELSVAHLREAIVLGERAGDTVLQATAHQHLGNNLLRMSDLAGAKAHVQTALAMNRAAGRVLETAYTLIDVGNIAYEQEDSDQALRLYEESATILRAQGDLWSLSICLSNMGRLASALGQFARAASLLTEALHLRLRFGGKHLILQAVDAVINLLTCMAVCEDQPVRRQPAREAVRLRAADTARRAELGLPEAVKDEDLEPHQDKLRRFLGEETCTYLEAEGNAMSMDAVVAATQETLAHIR